MMTTLAGAIEFLFQLETIYVLIGLMLWTFAGISFRDRKRPRRFGNGLFWFVLGLIFMAGGVLPHALTGMLVLLLVVLDGMNFVTRKKQIPNSAFVETDQKSSDWRVGNKIFLPVLLIPLVTFLTSVAFRALGGDANQGALIGLGFGGVAALGACLRLTKSKLITALEEGERLNSAMGAANILPQLLASLGAIFAASKVGEVLANGIHAVLPEGNLFLLVAANCVGMALLTMVMGNSFAAFPVIAAGVLVPLVVKPFGVDPAMAAIITLTAGSTGTLMTPMAANFNIVPAALLELRDQYGVIKYQIPFALVMLGMHILLLWSLIRF